MYLQKLNAKFLGVLFYLSVSLYGSQIYAQAYKDYVPPTPTAAALGKYVDQPVSLYTGTPEINIPLYEVKCGSLTLPISLNYHAGGFRVEEEASWVGLGWSLMAGGVVTRTIRHLKDSGFRNSFFDTYEGNVLDGASPYENYNLSKLSTNIFDGAPDLYSYNFSGNSGKFVNINGIKLLPKKPINVFLGSQDAFITIVDEKGNTYIFSDEEISQSKAAVSYEVSSWYLTKIISPSQDTITFEYKDTKFIQSVNLSESKTYVNSTYRYDKQSSEKYSTIINGLELSKIKFNQGEVHFISSYNRADLRSLSYKGGLRLDEIQVFDKLGERVKSYQMDYDYFLSSQTAIISDEKRLKLTSIREFMQPQSLDPGDIKMYHFTYNESVNLPSKQSFSQDHWGYYNGRNNQSLVPELIPRAVSGPTCASSSSIFQPNREPDTAACKANVLTQIKYPTGGYARFKYEAHDYGYINTDTLSIEIKQTNIQPFISMASAYFMHSNYGGTTVPTDIQAFTIAQEQCVKIEVNIQEGPYITPKGDPMAYLFQENGANDIEIARYSKYNNGTYYLTLEPGEYYLKAVSAMTEENIATLQLAYKTFDPVPSRIKYAGGVRVKKIVQHSGIGPDMIKSYDYKWRGSGWNANNNLSSGVLFTKPEYYNPSNETSLKPSYYYIQHKWFKEGDGDEESGPYAIPVQCIFPEHEYIVVNSNSGNLLNSGGHIGYREVSEMLGLNQDQGKSVYNFTTTIDYPYWTAGSGLESNWQRGLLLAKRDYRIDNKLLKKIVNNYETLAQGYEEFYGLTANIICQHPCSDDNNGYPRHYSQAPLFIISEWFYLKGSSETSYSGTDSIKTSTEYFYDNLAHLQPTRVITSTSNSNEVKVAATTYPDDYADTNSFVADLKAAHIIVPIEQVEYLQDAAGNNQMILKGNLTTYKAGSNNKGLKDQLWQLETNTPISLSNFKFSSRVLGALPNTTTKYNFQKDSRYKSVLTFDSYNLQNRPVQLTKSFDQPVAMIWSKDGEQLLAQVMNARADQVFYTSFEEDGAFSATAKTGDKVHTRNFTIPTGKEPVAGTYILSFWELQNGQWKYQEQQINYPTGSGALIITNNEIDEVRLYPVGTNMTTYTYKPLVGNTSVCDPNNQVTYYFYDSAGRLSHTKDDKGNVLQKYEYKYVNQ